MALIPAHFQPGFDAPDAMECIGGQGIGRQDFWDLFQLGYRLGAISGDLPG